MSALTNKIIGKLKQIEGKLTGDKLRVAQGTVEKTKGDVESAASRAVRIARNAVRRVKASIAGTTPSCGR